MKGITIGDSLILLDAVGADRDGRTVYGYSIRLDGVTPLYQARDIKSDCPVTEEVALASLLSLLLAAVESRRYRESTGREGDNESLFPPEVVDWAYQHDMEIQIAAIELEEGDK